MGFLDKLRGKKDEAVGEIKDHSTEVAQNKQSPSGKRIKRYTSEGKPIYE